ncbi:MAG: response regulator [Verrucomicrobiota bacterium]
MKKRKERILVLEDDRTSRRLICGILEKIGYDVLECSEGRDAIHIALMNPPKVIVVDVILPDMQGTQVVEQLLEHDCCKYTKPIFLTGILSNKEQANNRKFLFDIEGNRYRALPKPVKKSIFLKLVAQAVEESEVERLADIKEAAIQEEKQRAERAARLDAKAEERRKSLESVFEETCNGDSEDIPWYESESADR